MSNTIFPNVPPARARKLRISATLSSATCQVISGLFNPSSTASCSRTRSPVSSAPNEAIMPAAPPNWTSRHRCSISSIRSEFRRMLERYTAHQYPKVQGRACCKCIRPAIGLRLPLVHLVKTRKKNPRVTMGSHKALQNPLQDLKLSFHQNDTALHLKHGSIVAPQWINLAISSGVPSTNCRTNGRTGYPTISVSTARRS